MEINLAELITFWGIPSAVTGLCFWLIQRSISKRDANREKQEDARKKNELLLIRTVGASIALGEATARAIRDGHCNGEMTAALEYAQKVKHEQKDFLSELGIENLY